MKRLGAFILALMTVFMFSIAASAKTQKVPAAPEAKAYSASYQSIKIEWNKTKNTSGYIIYRSTKSNKGFKAIKTIKSASTLSYTDTKLYTGTVYYYRVQAYNKYGNSSTVTVSATPVLQRPVIKVSPTDSGITSVTITHAVDGAQFYEIYVCNKRNTVFRCIKNDIKSLKFRVVNQYSKVEYAYKVRAVRIVKGKKVYSAFSKIKSCTVL